MQISGAINIDDCASGKFQFFSSQEQNHISNLFWLCNPAIGALIMSRSPIWSGAGSRNNGPRSLGDISTSSIHPTVANFADLEALVHDLIVLRIASPMVVDLVSLSIHI